jgi:F-type H+-transporting ATPase subunit a
MKNLLLAIAIFLGLTNSVIAGGHAEEAEGGFNPSEVIMHHISDAHEWHFGGDFAVYLPVMIIDEGFKFLGSSSDFYHDIKEIDGHHYGVKGDYALFHEHIYKLENGSLNFDEEGHPTNQAIIMDFSITKNVASMLISAIILLLIFTTVAKGYKKNEGKAPNGLQSWLEPVIVFVRDDIAKLMIGHNYARFMPFLLTVFFFIWINNLLGLVPGGANLTGNIAFTLTLAFVTFIVTTISGNKAYWTHIFALPGVPKWTLVILTPIEIIGMFVKPIALMIRLFANISAGHIIILSIVSLIFIAGQGSEAIGWGVSPLVGIFTLVMNLMELLVAFLQAFIFTMLSALFIGQAVADHEHH